MPSPARRNTMPRVNKPAAAKPPKPAKAKKPHK